MSMECCISDPDNNFYGYTKRWDLWRFPLVKPYELVSPTNFSSEEWFFILHDFNPFGTESRYSITNIDSVAITDKYIFLHSERVLYPGGDRPAWLVINLEDDSKMLLTGQGRLKPWLDSARIEKIRIYKFEKILKDFQENLKLPPEWPG